MGSLGPILLDDLIKLINNCYASEHNLIELHKRAGDKKLQAYIRDCSEWYGEFGNHLRLVVASENVSAALNIDSPSLTTFHWIDQVNAKYVDSDDEILRIILDGHIHAVCQFKEINNRQNSGDLEFVLRKGRVGILDYFEKGKSLRNT